MVFHQDEDIEGGAKRKSGWSVGGVLTREERDNVVTMMQTFEEASTYTLQFWVSASPEVVAVDNAHPRRVEADILWTVGGNTLRRTITVGEATTIQGNADGVQVIVRDATLPNVLFPDTSQYNVLVTLARGTRAPGTIPFFQGDAQVNVNAGASVDIVIPSGIGVTGVLLPMSQSGGNFIPPSSTFVQEKLAGPGNALFTFDPVVYEWVPIVPGAARLTLTNKNAFAVQTSVLWQIEG